MKLTAIEKMSSSLLDCLTQNSGGWAPILIPIALLIISEVVDWIPDEKLKAGSITKLIVNIIKLGLQSYGQKTTVAAPKT